MPLILGTNSIKDTGYDVANSCRFNDGSSDSLNKTPSSNGTRTTWTFSIWLKRSSTSTTGHQIFDASPTPGSDESKIYFYNDFLYWKQEIGGGGADGYLVTNRKFRDVSAWYNIICQWNTTSGTESERMKIFVNGVQETSFSTANYPDQNRVSYINSTNNHYIGSSGGSASFFDGYMTEIVFIDGTALDQTSFGEFNSDSPTIWQPIDVSGLTFGTNGFYLDFEDSSNLGNDANGGTDFTVNNLTSVDQSTDTCTNNFATLNPLAIPTSGGANTFSNGNLEITNSADANRTSFSTIGVQSGKWYYECKVLSGEMKQFIGISKPQDSVDRIGNSANSYGYATETARKYNNSSFSSYGTTASSGDIIMVAFDADNGAIWVGKNGTWFASATQSEIEAGTTTNAMYSSITIDDFFMMGFSMEDSNIQVNFGSPMYAISSGNSDANGYGNFEYAVPSGYYALNTKNLAEFG